MYEQALITSVLTVKKLCNYTLPLLLYIFKSNVCRMEQSHSLITYSHTAARYTHSDIEAYFSLVLLHCLKWSLPSKVFHTSCHKVDSLSLGTSVAILSS